MSDSQAALDELTLDELKAGRKALFTALMSGTLSVQWADGSRVNYREMTDIVAAIRAVDARILSLLSVTPGNPAQQPILAFRFSPTSGFRS